MSDDAVDITHGGAIAVDTEALRDVAARLDPIATRVGEAADAVHQAHRWIVAGTGLSDAVDIVALWSTADSLAAFRARIDEVAAGTALMADVYELVELRAQRDALALTDEAAADAVQLRIDDLEATDERLSAMADSLVAEWELHRFDGLSGQFDLLSPTGLNVGAVTGAVALLGGSALFGKVPAGFVLKGTADPVAVRPVQTSTPVAPPASLAEAFRRFPQTDGAQVKVEKYTFADGSKRYVLYAKGTQSPWYGAGEPWDMKSNTELYAGERSASYQATVDALQQAGAEPGDAVDVYAHSQAGMIAAHLAMEGEFDVQVMATAGSPVEPTLADDQLLIQLRHTDDLVNALAGGGSPDGTGSPDSIVVQREGDPQARWQDLLLEPHMLDTYIETAELADASGDPRMDAYHDHLAELADAVSIEATEYDADRTGRAD